MTFATIPILKAAEFIERLTTFEEDRHLFRGVARAEYDLVPSALRAEGEHLPFGAVLNTKKEQVEAEAAILLAFYESVYFQGLTIPNWIDVRGSMEWIKKGDPSNVWPPPGSYEFLAIAQHHGIPTRLLDWTLDPMVAAYFAANDAERTTAEAAVWVFDTRAYEPIQVYDRTTTPITIPYDVNRNAHAQRGVFTLVSEIEWQRSPGDPPSRRRLDEFMDEKKVSPDGFRKITLPKGELPALLQLLDQRRINGASMYPGYDGAARAAKERRIWRHGSS